MIELGVNIDHVATVRQARRTYEPDPVWAAVEAQLAGAEGITVHLREDRRHIQDHDVERIQSACQVKLNLEMGATDEMVKIACRIKPDLVMLVPEGRQEVTTEGGLDVAGQLGRMKKVVKKLTDHGLVASAFIDTGAEQIDACAKAGFKVCEVHTGPYAHAFYTHSGDIHHPKVVEELEKVRAAGVLIRENGMQFNAGHALNYLNVTYIAGLDGIGELHIGHAIVSRAIFVGLREAVREMKRLMETGARRSQGTF
jgi:pyridoxine 5-phosphate synthase